MRREWWAAVSEGLNESKVSGIGSNPPRENGLTHSIMLKKNRVSSRTLRMSLKGRLGQNGRAIRRRENNLLNHLTKYTNNCKKKAIRRV